METYNKLRKVPEDALKVIQAGRLRGKSDIKPQWRIEIMTDTFGVIGFGWNYKVTRSELIHSEQTKETACFVDIELKVKMDGEWSEPIFGTGGSMFIAQEKAGAYTSDECFKMALTDAMSVAMKQLGVAADVYRGLCETKYEADAKDSKPQSTEPQPEKWLNETNKDGTLTPEWSNVCKGIREGTVTSVNDVRKYFKVATRTAEKIETLIKTK